MKLESGVAVAAGGDVNGGVPAAAPPGTVWAVALSVGGDSRALGCACALSFAAAAKFVSAVAATPLAVDGVTTNSCPPGVVLLASGAPSGLLHGTAELLYCVHACAKRSCRRSLSKNALRSSSVIAKGDGGRAVPLAAGCTALALVVARSCTGRSTFTAWKAPALACAGGCAGGERATPAGGAADVARDTCPSEGGAGSCG
ncbi:hypothetical protein EON62_04210 [archaeon]|nr:MAG: hypothetical protein EON62_04210 [archaeon]